MTALAVTLQPQDQDEATALAAVDLNPEVVSGGIPQEIAEAEARSWQGLIIGIAIAIGLPVCALLWIGLVALALAIADPGWPVWPALGMAAVVGVFAGMFLGGWAGVTARAEALDEAELHASRGH